MDSEGGGLRSSVLAVLFRISGEASGPAFFDFSQVRRQGHGAVRKPAGQVRACAREVVGIIVEAGEFARGGVGAKRVEDLKPRANVVAEAVRLVIAWAEAQKRGVASLGADDPLLDARHHARPGARAHRVDAVHQKVRSGSPGARLRPVDLRNPPACREQRRHLPAAVGSPHRTGLARSRAPVRLPSVTSGGGPDQIRRPPFAANSCIMASSFFEGKGSKRVTRVVNRLPAISIALPETFPRSRSFAAVT